MPERILLAQFAGAWEPDPIDFWDPIEDQELQQCIATYAWVANTIEYDSEAGVCMCTISTAEPEPCAELNDQFLTQQLCVPKYWTEGVIEWSTRNSSQAACTCSAWAITWANDVLICLPSAYDDFGIHCSPSEIMRGECTWNVNKTLWLPDNKWMTNPTQIMSDLVLGVTGFVGTAMVIALVVMGIKYVAWGMNESSTWDLKWNIKKLLIWLLLIVGSFTIIRIVQYIARGF